MLQGILKALLFGIGHGLISLGYGKKGMEAREKLGISSKGLVITFGVLVLVWLFGLFSYFAFPGSEDTIISIVIIIICPLIYAVWAVLARRSLPELLEKAQMSD